MKHTLTALLQDRPGALNRAVSLFRRRGFNIESLNVAPSGRPGLSRLTIVVDEPNIDQVAMQFARLIEVVEVEEIANHAGTGLSPTAPAPFTSQADGASDDVAA